MQFKFNPLTNQLDLVGSGGSASLTLTTTGTSGAATLVGTTLNIPVYSSGGATTPGGLNTQLQYNNNGVFGGITGAVTDGTAVSLTAAHLLNPTINGAGAGLATLVYPNTASNATITVPATTGTLALTSQLTSGTVTSVASADGSITVTNPTTTVDLAVVKAPIWTTARLLAGNSVNGSANVAFANKFIVQGTTDTGLSGAQFLGALTTGIVKNTTTTGILSIAVAADFPTLNQNTTGSAATLTTPRAINGVNFDGSAAITVTAAAGTLTGTTLNSTVVTSSLTSLGSSASLPGSPTTTTQSPADNSTKVATTAYVDNAVLGQNYKEATLVATTANLVGVYLSGVFTYTATGTDNIDGVNLALGNRVLVKNQTTTFQNGWYVVTTAGAIGVAGVLTRSTDANTSGEFKTGDTSFVISGTVNASTTWAYTGVDSPTLGTDAITYVQVAGLGSYVAGNGLTLTGNSFSIDTSITVDKTTVQTLTNKSIVATQLTGTLQAGQFPALTGDITTTAGALATTLATVNSNVGSFTNASITVNGKGLITAASNGTAPVTSVTGTTNRITVTGTTSAVVDIAATYVGQSSITTLGTVTTGVWTGTTIAIANGGTGVTSVTTAPAATAFAGWDANKNLSANAFSAGFTTTATAGGSTSMTIASTQIQLWTGTLAQTVLLPTTGVPAGQQYYIYNSSSGLVTVQSSSGASLHIITGGTAAIFTSIIATPTSAGNWRISPLNVLGSSGKISQVLNSINFQGTDTTTMTFPTVSDTLAGITATQTLTNKRINPRVVSTTQAAAPAINSDNGDIFEIVSLAQAITNMSTNLTGTPVEGGFMEIIIKDNGTARAITWGTSFVASTVALPTTTVISTPIAALFQWRSSAVWTATSAWYCIAVA